MTEQHYDPTYPDMRALGLTDEQIDAAIARREGAVYVDPNDLPAAPVDPTPTAPTWTCETPPGAFLYSLNGFDEIAISVRFGAPILALREDPIGGGRALAFVHQRRVGKTDADAYAFVMGMTMREVMGYFAPEPKADPVRAEGNDPSATA